MSGEKEESKEKEEDGMVTLVVTMEEQLLRMIDSSEEGFHTVAAQRETGELQDR